MLSQGFSVIAYFSLKQFYDTFIIKKLFYNVVYTSNQMLSFLHRRSYCSKCKFDRDVKIEKYCHHDTEQLSFYKNLYIKTSLCCQKWKIPIYFLIPIIYLILIFIYLIFNALSSTNPANIRLDEVFCLCLQKMFSRRLQDVLI